MRQKKSVDPAEVQRRLAVLEPQLEKLQQQAEAEQDPKKKLKLGKKVDQVRDKDVYKRQVPERLFTGNQRKYWLKGAAADHIGNGNSFFFIQANGSYIR